MSHIQIREVDHRLHQGFDWLTVLGNRRVHAIILAIAACVVKYIVAQIRTQLLGDGGWKAVYLYRRLRFEYDDGMRTLVEIEAEVDALPSEQKQEILLFVAARLRAEGRLPQPRRFSSDQVKAWISEDEADMRRFNGGP